MIGKRNIFLIGSMGSGKSAVGRQLARMLKVPFYDSDVEVERRTGVDIPFIFEREGEAGFRLREREALAELTMLEPIVLATGGGAILDADNRRLLAQHGCVIYLEASITQQLHRVGSGRNRPLLHNVDPAVRLGELRIQREPLYREIADHVVSTDNRRVQKVAEDILRKIATPPAPT